MGEGEGGNLGSGGEAPGGIFKNAPIYGLCQPDKVTLAGGVVFPARNHQFLDPICVTVVINEG